MKLKPFLIILLFAITNADYSFGAKKSRNFKIKGTKTLTTLKTSNTKTIQEETPKDFVSTDTCTSDYTRCMNNICSNDTLGKCVCYENKTMNSGELNFVNIDGMKIKQGFELFEYAKKQCVMHVDKCKNDRRAITEKYKNSIQKDCLILSNASIGTTGIAAELKELKTCMKDICNPMNINGFEDFSFAEYNLCFNDNAAKFAMAATCSNIIQKSSSPLSLKQLFLDDMALRREKSCNSMGGTLSNDRKKCYVTIKYGPSKENIKASKKVAVGDYLECSASFFDTKMSETKEYRQAMQNRIMSSVATGFSIAGAGLSIAGTADPIGTLIDSGIELGSTAADIGLDIKDFKEGKIDEQTFGTQLTSNGISAILSAASIAAKGSSLINQTSKATKVANTTIKTKDVLKAAASGVSAVSMGTDIVMDSIADKAQKEEEENAIIQHAVVDRNTGIGQVQETITQHGNCFLQNEWFATENELVLLLWKN